MTTLRSFQAEIEQISSEKQKQAIRETREAHAAAELARHHGKLPKAQTLEVHEGENGNGNVDEPEAQQSLEVSSQRDHELMSGCDSSWRRCCTSSPTRSTAAQRTWRAAHPSRRPSSPVRPFRFRIHHTPRPCHRTSPRLFRPGGRSRSLKRGVYWSQGRAKRALPRGEGWPGVWMLASSLNP